MSYIYISVNCSGVIYIYIRCHIYKFKEIKLLIMLETCKQNGDVVCLLQAIIVVFLSSPGGAKWFKNISSSLILLKIKDWRWRQIIQMSCVCKKSSVPRTSSELHNFNIVTLLAFSRCRSDQYSVPSLCSDHYKCSDHCV